MSTCTTKIQVHYTDQLLQKVLWKLIAIILLGFVLCSCYVNYNVVTRATTQQEQQRYQATQFNTDKNTDVSNSNSMTSRSIVYNSGKNGHNSSLTIDIVSIGSLLKQSFHDAQQNTFIQHDTIRDFYRINELMDADQECYTGLLSDELNDVLHFCETTNTTNAIAEIFRKVEFKPKKAPGWICAQKRPLDGLYYVLNMYRNNKNIELPNYIFIIDDDTYIHMDRLLPVLKQNFPSHTTQVVAGCNIKASNKHALDYPYGGFGSYISRASIQRLLQPIYCSSSEDTNQEKRLSDPFNKLSCWRLKENLMGERRFFTDGMSIIDLMYQFSYQQSFRNVSSWEDRGGFCLHSDQALAYFFNFYHIAVPDHELQDENFRINDKYRKKYKYTTLHRNWKYPRWEGECYNEFVNSCKKKTKGMVCHYIKPDEMLDIYATIK